MMMFRRTLLKRWKLSKEYNKCFRRRWTKSQNKSGEPRFTLLIKLVKRAGMKFVQSLVSMRNYN